MVLHEVSYKPTLIRAHHGKSKTFLTCKLQLEFLPATTTKRTSITKKEEVTLNTVVPLWSFVHHVVLGSNY